MDAIDVITVPEQVYEEMKEIKEDSVYLSNAFTQLQLNRFDDAYKWIYGIMHDAPLREQKFTQYFYGKLDIKPELKHYRVYKEWHTDTTEDLGRQVFYVGLDQLWIEERPQDFVPALYQNSYTFDILTQQDIDEFERGHNVKIPQDWIHKID